MFATGLLDGLYYLDKSIIGGMRNLLRLFEVSSGGILLRILVLRSVFTIVDGTIHLSDMPIVSN